MCSNNASNNNIRNTSNKPSSNVTTSQSGHFSNQKSPGYVEYRLKSSILLSTLKHHVMIMPDKSYSFNSLIPPIKLNRKLDDRLINKINIEKKTEHVTTGTQEGGSITVAPFGTKALASLANGTSSGKPKQPFRRKAQIIIHSDSNIDGDGAKRLKDEETKPWVLEESDGRCLQGKLEGFLSQKYVLFVNKGNDIRVMLVNKWYKFNPKIQYHTLSLEEAEKNISQRKGLNVSTSNDRWIMSQHNKSSEEAKLSRMDKFRMKIEKSESSSNGLGSLKLDKESDDVDEDDIAGKDEEGEDEVDYEDVFEDDELEMIPDEDIAVESTKGLEKRTSRKGKKPALNKSGIELKKTLRHLDKNLTFDDTDDEEKDPYAFSDEQEDSSNSTSETESDAYDKDKVKKGSALETSFISPSSPPGLSPPKAFSFRPQPKKIKTIPSPKSVKPISVLTTTSSPTGSTAAPSTLSTLLPSPSTEIPLTGDAVLTENEIIHHLKNKTLRTKDLITIIKGKLKAHPANTERFKAIIKKVATVKVGQTEDERILELKEEYR